MLFATCTLIVWEWPVAKETSDDAGFLFRLGEDDSIDICNSVASLFLNCDYVQQCNMTVCSMLECMHTP